MTTRTKTITGIAVAVVALFCLFGIVRGTSADQSPEDILKQAYELRMKARRGHCEVLGTRISACYGGDRGACNKMTDSFSWFTNEYGDTPEVACPAEDSPFGAGGDGR